MKSFDDKWQACVRRGRQAPPRDTQPPFGFAARIAAQALRHQPPPSERVWLKLALPSLAGTLALLAVCAVLELPHLHARHPLAPGVENTVAALVWTL